MHNLKERINKNEVVLGTMLSEVYTPNVVRVIKAGGMEFIIIDSEHGYFDYSQIANIVAVCNGFDIPIIVRVPNIDRASITKVLDMGVDGLLIPMVNTALDAENVVNYAKYAPLGARGISTTRAHTNYEPPKLSEYIEHANNKTIILAQIETKQALLNADKIIEVEGIDALIIGPNDLAIDLGTPGDFETASMEKSIETVVASARKAKKPCGIVASNIGFLHKCKDMGMTIFSCNSEVGMIKSASKKIVKEFYES